MVLTKLYFYKSITIVKIATIISSAGLISEVKSEKKIKEAIIKKVHGK